ncbi:NAD(P)-dependent alcohol dehydrogenase [Nocardia panacis]|uniref:NAD(P)-dependent alcohol dehydrogenase n=1 Tax=Nocardia panacis TaxID=2340916 RepID=A0A3A4KDW4_9NOCA|nr:NAD(P)-dependent alcohol dehydrogenase [Nocardia panacis]
MPALAAIVERPGAPFRFEEVTLDGLRPDEIRVRLHAAGVCHTDLNARAGNLPFPMPAVFGHEGAGVVEAVGTAVTTPKPGERVVLSFASCGGCRACRAGRPVRCGQWGALNLSGGSRLDGTATLHREHRPVHGHFFGQSAFATRVTVNARSAIPVPDDVPLDVAAPLGCSVQTGAGAVLRILRPTVGSSLAIFGAGAVGLSALLAARLTPAGRIIAVDLRPERLAIARELGAQHLIDAREGDVAARIREISDGGVHYALDTTGDPSALRTAVDSLAIAGVCGVIGAAPPNTEVRLDMAAMLDRLPRLIGINQGDADPRSFIPQLLELYRSGRLPYDKFITRFRFSEIEAAAQAAARGAAIKPVLLFDVDEVE